MQEREDERSHGERDLLMRRIVVYLFYDRDGIVDEYIPYKLRALRPHADHIFVVANGQLTSAGRRKLTDVADTVWVRENKGFDVGAFHDSMADLGPYRLAEYDELILMNYTFFGPIFPFEPMFERMEALDVDFWGVSSHGPVRLEGPDVPEDVIPRHLQTHWLSVRRQMFTSAAWT